jgi:hypothetical protein
MGEAFGIYLLENYLLALFFPFVSIFRESERHTIVISVKLRIQLPRKFIFLTPRYPLLSASTSNRTTMGRNIVVKSFLIECKKRV